VTLLFDPIYPPVAAVMSAPLARPPRVEID